MKINFSQLLVALVALIVIIALLYPVTLKKPVEIEISKSVPLYKKLNLGIKFNNKYNGEVTVSIINQVSGKEVRRKTLAASPNNINLTFTFKEEDGIGPYKLVLTGENGKVLAEKYFSVAPGEFKLGFSCPNPVIFTKKQWLANYSVKVVVSVFIPLNNEEIPLRDATVSIESDVGKFWYRTVNFTGKNGKTVFLWTPTPENTTATFTVLAAKGGFNPVSIIQRVNVTVVEKLPSEGCGCGS